MNTVVQKTYSYPQFDYVQSEEQRTQTLKRHPVVIIGAGPGTERQSGGRNSPLQVSGSRQSSHGNTVVGGDACGTCLRLSRLA